MKVSSLLLGASLIANAALVACLVLGVSNPSPVISSRTAATGATGAAATAAAGSPTAETWTALHSEDLTVQRDRLIAEGFPPAMIRAILAAQIREGFAARRKAFDTARGEIPFWKTVAPDPQAQAAMRAIAKEEQKALTDLLGPDPENGSAATLQRQLPNLPADKIAQLAAIRDDYGQRRSDIYANQGPGGTASPADRDKLAALDKAMHAEIAATLTPQELEDYDLRTSNTANQLRYSLTAFDATEQEFRTLFQLQQAFNDRIGTQYGGPLSQDEMKARSDAQKQLNDDIKAAFGDARYAEYQRANDYNFRQTSQLVARLQLPPETTNEIYALQQDIQQRARTIQTNRALTQDDRTQQLAALVDEVRTKLTPGLGESGFEAYKQYGGSWLQNLQPRPLPAAGVRPAIPGGGP